MSPEKRPRPRRSGIESEEEKAWVEFYHRVHKDGALATEVLVQLETDPEMKRRHLALYLSCKETLRREKARQARHKRIGLFVRWLVQKLVDKLNKPWRTLREVGGTTRDIAIEMLPEASSMAPAAPRALSAAAEASPSSPGVNTPRRSRKVRSDAPAPAAAGAEKADPASS